MDTGFIVLLGVLVGALLFAVNGLNDLIQNLHRRVRALEEDVHRMGN